MLCQAGISCGHLAAAQSNKTQSTEEKINDHSQHESHNGCPLPRQHPYYHFITPQRAVSRCPPPALLAASTCFPLLPIFLCLKGGDFLIDRFSSSLVCSTPLFFSDPDGPTVAYANSAPFPRHKYQLKRVACLHIHLEIVRV